MGCFLNSSAGGIFVALSFVSLSGTFLTPGGVDKAGVCGDGRWEAGIAATWIWNKRDSP